ncbi:MAG: phytanoyl-CoA dioxygenase family protein [Caulobacteraceae bacterium]|nr:phytanoyl-CoA dioxygenase family protein [Caulobacteraceae bacterium]
MPLFLPDADEIDIGAIRPVTGLRDSAPDLGDRALLNRRYEADGYLFFRGLLPKDAVLAARRDMMAPFLSQGLIDEDCVWLGGDQAAPFGVATFAGVWPRLFQRPGIREALDRLLGEPAATVPMVQYRAYPPGGAMGGVHQDGFYSPGIKGYRPVWIPLIEMDQAMGGLALATGFTGRDYIHNVAKSPNSPIPAGVIPDGAWLRADYAPSDVLVIHPQTPHVGLPNRSRKVRFSIDTRVESAADPATLVGELVNGSANAVTLRCGDGALRTLAIDDETFIRTGPKAGTRLSRSDYLELTPPGELILASKEGDRALMLRRAEAG